MIPIIFHTNCLSKLHLELQAFTNDANIQNGFFIPMSNSWI